MTLEQRLYDGDRAKEVLENEQFQAAFEAIEKEFIEAWKTAPVRDAEGREKLWLCQHLLAKVRKQLESTLETGKLAKIELQHRQGLIERAKSLIG